MVLCEKPLARDAKEGAADGARRSRRPASPNMVWYNYRRVPAVTLDQADRRRGQARQDLPLPRQLPAGLDDLARRAAGRRRHLAARRRRPPGSGVTGDLLAHCIDTAIWINGAISTRHRDDRDLRQGAQARADRQGREGRHRRRRAVLRRFANGSLGTFESTRYARGHKALYTLEINGEHGSLNWDLHDLNRLQWFDHRVEGHAARLDRSSSSPTASTPISASGGCPA